MKKNNKRNTAKAASTLALAGSLLMLPGVYQTSKAQDDGAAQRATGQHIKSAKSVDSFTWKLSSKFVKMGNDISIAGLEKGVPVYKNSKGEYFTVNPTTGDLKYLANDMFIKMEYIKFDGIKGEASGRFKGIKYDGSYSIVGLDNAGRTILKNSRGETFYLNPENGDFVYVK